MSSVNSLGSGAPETLDDVRSKTSAQLAELLTGVRDVAVLDFPNHQNVGDTMIWLGEMVYLKQLGINVRYISDMKRFSSTLLEKLVPAGPILLHGGGNFGDLWPEYQSFRETIAARFPNRLILQMPQSVEFKDHAAAARANAVFGNHAGFRLLVRDRRSLERAQTLLPDVKVGLCHDAALGWQPRVRGARSKRRHRVLVLARRDREKGLGVEEILRESLQKVDRVTDWGLVGLGAFLWRLARMPLGLARIVPWLADSSAFYPILRLAYNSLARLNASAGLRLFTRSQAIATDRLHAHVLAVLLGQPHLVVDNSYGKIGGVVSNSTERLGILRLVARKAEAAGAFAWLVKASAGEGDLLGDEQRTARDGR
jgi:pyruvyl transferase EpsO